MLHDEDDEDEDEEEFSLHGHSMSDELDFSLTVDAEINAARRNERSG